MKKRSAQPDVIAVLAAHYRRVLELYIDLFSRMRKLHELSGKEEPPLFDVERNSRGGLDVRRRFSSESAATLDAEIMRLSDEIKPIEKEFLVALKQTASLINSKAVTALEPLVARPRRFAVDLKHGLDELQTLHLWSWNDVTKTVTPSTRWKPVQRLSRMLAILETDREIVQGGKSPTQPRTRRRRRSTEPKALTAKQAEAIYLFGDHHGNLSKGARAMGVNRKTFEQHVKAANAKLGKQAIRPKTVRASADPRGQAEIAGMNDGDGVQTLGKGRGIRRDQRHS